MEQSTIILWAVIAILAVMFGGFIFIVVRRTRRISEKHHEETEALRAAHALELSETHAQHRDVAASERHDHEDQIRRLAADHDRQAATADRERAGWQRMHAKALSTLAYGMRWELASREQLVRACERADLDAVVVTNVVFAPAHTTDDPYCAQIDHVVITNDFVLLVESKNWAGTVFDGRRPSLDSAALSTVVDDAQLVPPFAVQLARSSDSSLELRFHEGGKSPTRQVRRQAARFSAYLRTRMPAAPRIDTCVFYSHPKAHIVSGEPFVDGDFRTVVATSSDLTEVLADVQHAGRQSPKAVHLETVVAAVRDLGADLVGVGRFAAEYVSPVDLGYRVKEKSGPASKSRAKA